MKVTEPIHIEFLQTEGLEDFFVFHRHRPMPEVMRYPATTEECRTENYFCGSSRNRNCERNEKLTGERRRAAGRKVQPRRLMHPSGSRRRDPGLAFDRRGFRARSFLRPWRVFCRSRAAASPRFSIFRKADRAGWK
jgi:hypothetical protein